MEILEPRGYKIQEWLCHFVLVKVGVVLGLGLEWGNVLSKDQIN